MSTHSHSLIAIQALGDTNTRSYPLTDKLPHDNTPLSAYVGSMIRWYYLITSQPYADTLFLLYSPCPPSGCWDADTVLCSYYLMVTLWCVDTVFHSYYQKLIASLGFMSFSSDNNTVLLEYSLITSWWCVDTVVLTYPWQGSIGRRDADVVIPQYQRPAVPEHAHITSW